MYYTIYKTTNMLNGKFYIGKHQTLKPDDGYFGSGKSILMAIKKYGKENFKKEILFVFDNEDDMNAKEKELINEEFVLREDTYNLGIGGEGGAHFKGRSHSTETKLKLRNVTFTEERKLKMREKQIGKKHSEETKKKIADSRRNRSPSEETRRKISESMKNRKVSDQTKKKISDTMKKNK